MKKIDIWLFEQRDARVEIFRRCQTWSSANQSILRSKLSPWRVNRYSIFSQKFNFEDRSRIPAQFIPEAFSPFDNFYRGKGGLTSRWRMYHDSSRKHIRRSHVGKVVKALFTLPSKLHALRLGTSFCRKCRYCGRSLYEAQSLQTIAETWLRVLHRNALLLLSFSPFLLLPDCISC